MIRGYAEGYINDAMNNLGESFDYAVNACRIDADDFMKLFVSSGIADQFENGNPKYVVGQSGTELVLDVLKKTGVSIVAPSAQVCYDCSPEYWAGWALAYYQWKSGISFRDIHRHISMENILNMYPTLHETSEDKFADVANEILKRKEHPSKLQQQRKKVGYSQRELSEKSGVNLRTLQQYELGTKRIARASVETVMALANALGCDIEAILELQG